MKIDWKKILPHILAIVVFLIIAVLYCRPAFEGKTIESHDWTSWSAMSKDADNYAAKHGHYPQWTNGIFSGMPSYQIAFNTNAYIGWYLPEVLTLGLPKPASYFFLACICFYLLTQVLSMRPIVGIFGALAYAYATYNPVIISVTHHTKMISLGLMPGVLAGFFLIFNKKYVIGTAITAVFLSCVVATNHLQISYYTFLVILIMAISYAVYFIKNGEIKRLATVAGFSLIAVLVGVLSNAVQLYTTYDYAPETIRGGSALALTDTVGGKKANVADASGLDSAYAMSYSMSIPEPLVLAVPRMFGGSNLNANADQLPEDGKLAEVFSQYPGLAQQFPASAYWGGIGGTSGPPYSGAIICLLAIFGMFIIDNKYRWWLAGGVLFACIMSWGGYFYGFNKLLFQYLPFYNKFRAPSMALVIPQLLLPVMAALTLDKLLSPNFVAKDNQKAIKTGLIAVASFVVLLFVVYASASFQSPQEAGMMKQVNSIPDAQTKEVYKSAFTALTEDRKSIALGDIGRTLGFGLLAAAILFAFLKRWINPLIAGIALIVFCLADLLSIDSKYLNADSYTEKSEYGGVNVAAPELVPSAANLAIQKDKSIYRVYDARQVINSGGKKRGVDPFSEAALAYHHNLVNGYHAAKLSVYMDLIQHQLAKGNPRVFDMLNTKYFVVNDARGEDSAVINPTAQGPAWFVKGITFVKGPRDEMNALDYLNVRDSAVVQESFKAETGGQPQWDSTASIKVTNYDNDEIDYAINARTPQFAVLSEVYYSRGWNAYADGKQVPIVKTNYVLRGVAIPAGTKKLELKFEPQAYKTGYRITAITSIIMVILLLGGIVLEILSSRKKTAA